MVKDLEPKNGNEHIVLDVVFQEHVVQVLEDEKSVHDIENDNAEPDSVHEKTGLSKVLCFFFFFFSLQFSRVKSLHAGSYQVVEALDKPHA